MGFSVVVDSDIQLALRELAGIFDLELGVETYKPTLKKMVEEEDVNGIVKELEQMQGKFLKFKRKAFEASVNLYVHVVSLPDLEESRQQLVSGLISNMDLSCQKEVETQITPELAIISLTNIFNFLPVNSHLRYDALSAIVRIISINHISSTMPNIAAQIEQYFCEIENLSEQEISEVLTAVFQQYVVDDECKSVEFGISLIQDEKVPLNSQFLITFFSTVLKSSKLYDISSLKDKFSLTNDAVFSKLLELYIAGDYKQYSTCRDEFKQYDNGDLELKFQTLAVLNYLASSQNETNAFSYKSIAGDLDIPIQDIELILFDLISQNFIVGKLSQSNESIILNQVNYSAMSLKANKSLVDWKEINTLLSTWNQNVSSLQTLVQELINKRGKKVNAPQVMMAFHQQKVEAKEAREKKEEPIEQDA